MSSLLRYAILSAVLTAPAVSSGGLWWKKTDCAEPLCAPMSCADNGCCAANGCDNGLCCSDGTCCRSCCKTCQGQCKSVTVKKYCWQTECEEICIPPVQLPCCGCLLKGTCGGCCDSRSGGCAAGCTGCPTCQPAACCQNGLLKKLFGKCAGCRVRCVSRLKAEDYECEQNVMEWKVACCGDCAKCCCGSGCGDNLSVGQPSVCTDPVCCAPIGCAPCKQ